MSTLTAAELRALALAEKWRICDKARVECERDPCLWCQANRAKEEEARASGRDKT